MSKLMKVQMLVLNSTGLEMAKNELPCDTDECMDLMECYIDPEFVMAVEPNLGRPGFIFVNLYGDDLTIKDTVDGFFGKVESFLKMKTLLPYN